jgi:glycosyltransferase involved in cell wall biosynthesis
VTTTDVTVSLAVYNTMPYLQQTLDSLVAQSIGHGRLEVVAVDDGSTDGSGELLDAYAAGHPDLFRVVHQENSGGPAGPCNRALDAAHGRFVYFLGADDHLGPEALERMVDYADEHDADIVMGRVVGVNGRDIRQAVFRRNDPDLDRYGPELRWSLANTNLYRRSLLERIGLRYVEGLPFGSDQPFMLEAVVHASRIAVLADYTCYYAVDRHERTNISYSTSYAERLRCIEVLVSTAARLVPEGRPRDTMLVRHFTWEVPSLLRQGFRELPESFEQVVADVASFADRYGNDAIFAELRVVPRVLLRLAALGRVDLLRQMLAEDAPQHPRLVVGEAGVYVDYPGFCPRDPEPTYLLPDQRGFRDRFADAMSTESATWEGSGVAGRLVVAVGTNLTDPAGHARIGAVARRPGENRVVQDVSVVEGDAGATVLVRLPAADLAGPEVVGGSGHDGWRLVLRVTAGEYDVEVPVPRASADPGHARFLRGGSLGTAWCDEETDALVVHARRIPWAHVPRAVARRLVSGRR